MADTADGAAGIRVAVELFYQRLLADPVLSRWFDGVDLGRLKAHQREFLLMAIGGPELYQGRDMATAHAGLAIDGENYDRAVRMLEESLTDAGITGAVSAAVSRRLAPLRGQIVTA